ncbi:MAG: DUF4145 domain-containing protein [Caldilineaceae bacterium]
MKIEENNQIIEAFLTYCNEICSVTKTAFKNKKSLSGSNFYGNKFHDLLVEISRLEIGIRKLIVASGLENCEEEKFSPYLNTLKSPATPSAKKTDSLKQLRLFFKSELLPRLEGLKANHVPESEQVLPMTVVQNTRGYIERIALQANGCYEHQWYDACAVMIRRLVETLIIQLYEAKGKAPEIQDKDGNFSMLNVLVNKITTDTSWNLGRETKAALPLLKSVGDRSAHNRHYLANKADIDKVLPGLRVTVDDLLHLSGLK